MKKTFLLLLIAFGFSLTNATAQQYFTTNETVHVESGDLMIPNAFSPNGDGKNDVFKVLNFTNQTLLEFKVFNRWGTFVFESEDAKKGWDGNYKGKTQPIGVYGYIIRIAYPEGVVETYKGTVTLIR